jgi:hypothetical protein
MNTVSAESQLVNELLIAMATSRSLEKMSLLMKIMKAVLMKIFIANRRKNLTIPSRLYTDNAK